MSDTVIIILIVAVILILLISFYFFKKYKISKQKGKDKPKKIEKIKVKKEKKIKQKPEDMIDLKGSYVDIADKFLFRKEFKLLIIVNRILPKGYVAFPKVGVDLILVPLGNKTLYDSIQNQYIDLVVFEEDTMKPKVAIDLYDGTIGDEQLDVENPTVVKALKVAELPLISFRVKTDYTTEEIKDPIYEALGINDKKIEHIAE